MWLIPVVYSYKLPADFCCFEKEIAQKLQYIQLYLDFFCF